MYISLAICCNIQVTMASGLGLHQPLALRDNALFAVQHSQEGSVASVLEMPPAAHAHSAQWPKQTR